VARAALHATYEALLRGSGCGDSSNSSNLNHDPAAWFVDAGSDDDELLALASSIGCGVSALDPKVQDARAVEMTRCMNEEPGRPFGVLQVATTDVTDAQIFAEILNGTYDAKHYQTKADDKVKKKQKKKQKSRKGKHGKHKTLIAGVTPVMLNRKSTPAEDSSDMQESEISALEQQKFNTNATATFNSSQMDQAAEANSTHVASPRRGVRLDSLFTKPDIPNASGPVTIATSEGGKLTVNNIAVLKVTPRREGDAPLKALEGARGLIESGRVQCLVTEMNFDLNHTDALLAYFAELEHAKFEFAHLGSLDYSELEVTDHGAYPVFLTDTKQLHELFDTYKRIRSFDERSGFRVYSGSLSLDRSGHYFDYTDVIFACKKGFPDRMAVMPKGRIRFKNGVWWLEK
jgi:hypothetical protein